MSLLSAEMRVWRRDVSVAGQAFSMSWMSDRTSRHLDSILSLLLVFGSPSPPEQQQQRDAIAERQGAMGGEESW
jgi:hypothetical protein